VKKLIQSIITIITVSVIFSAPSSFAARARVHYLSGDNLNPRNLTYVLRTKGPRPRGVGLMPPNCSHLREKASRGIELTPKSDIASIMVEFDFNSAELTPASEKTLDTLAQALNSETLKPCCFEIDGYTDAVGSSEYNQKLSEERAQSVIDYMSSHDRIESQRMMPKGYGKTHFIASNATEEGRQKNRRVQVVNLGYGDLGTQN
jgi:outer membrane protein OmpA-like peptidoglycan-associated protein